MLHLSSIYNTCYRMLMFGNCDCDHHDCSSWHFWHIVYDSSTLSIMVQYLWIYSLSVIWRYYMKVMFIFSMPTRVLLQITINSLQTSSSYQLHSTIPAITEWSVDRVITASNRRAIGFNDRCVHQYISFNIGATFRRIDVTERIWEITSVMRRTFAISIVLVNFTY
jgi:hypothetical protein